MSKEIARKAIGVLIGGQTLKGSRLEVVLIGGEPLINFEVARFAIDSIEQLARDNDASYRVGLNTNGTILTDEMIAYLSARPVDMVFSIDGPEQVHNKNRHFADGSSSYDTAIANLKRWVTATGRSSRIQATFTDIEDMEGAIRHFYKMGVPLVMANPALKTRHSQAHMDLSRTEEDQVVVIHRKMGEHFIETAGRGDSRAVFSTMQLMGKIHRRDVRGPGCGAGNICVVDSFGDIYPCQGLVGWQEYKLGDVDSGVDDDAKQRFLQQMQTYARKCIGCWAQSVCGAACIATAIANGIMDEEYPSVECSLRKRLAEIAIETYAGLMATVPEAADRLFGVRPQN